MSVKVTNYPSELFIYICDYDDGSPIYAAAATLDEIPEGEHGSLIGKYMFKGEANFFVRRELSAEV